MLNRGLALLASASVLLITACGGLSGGVGNGTAVGTPGSATPGVPQVQHVVMVVLENTNYGDVAGTQKMPYLNSVIAKGALVPHYFANTHPSLPNYFILTTGLPLTNNDSYSGTVTTDNVVRELAAAGKTWRVYADAIPSAGYLGQDKGSYLQHHNPFVFLSDVQQSTTNAANIVPFTQFSSDVSGGTLPNYSFIVPNAQNDAHSCADGSLIDCSLTSRLQHADSWLQTNMAPLLGNPGFAQSGLLMIVFDESEDDFTNGGGHVVAVLAGTHVKPNYAGGTQEYDHRSLLSLSMKSLGVATTPNGADAAPQMTEFFQ